MPKFLKEWLASLTDEQAETLWEYFDGNPMLATDLVMAVVNSHQKLLKEGK